MGVFCPIRGGSSSLLAEEYPLCQHGFCGVFGVQRVALGIKRRSFLSIAEPMIIPLGFAWTVGACLASFCWQGFPLQDVMWWGCFALVALLSVASLLGPSDSYWRKLGVWSFAAILLGGAYYDRFHFHGTEGGQLYRFLGGGPVELEGVLESPIGRKSSPVLAVSRLNGERVLPPFHRLQLSLSKATRPLRNLSSGTQVWAQGRLRAPRTAPFPEGFDEQEYLESHRVVAVLEDVSGFQLRPTAHPNQWSLGWMWQWIEDARGAMLKTYRQALPGNEAAVLASMVMGDHASPVDRDIREAFTKTGLVHLLAASGMNVGIVMAFLMWLLSLIPRLPRRLQWVITMGGVLLYGAVTGFPPSIQRAVLMVEIALLLKIWDTQLTPLALLSMATSILVTFFPDNVRQLGFQFSVLTTFGLLTMVPPLVRWSSHWVPPWLSGAVWVPLIAQLWVLPLSIYWFNATPLHSVLMNVVALFFTVPLTNAGFFIALVHSISPELAVWVCSLTHFPLQGLLWITDFASRLPGTQWEVPSPSRAVVIFSYCVLLLLVLFALIRGNVLKPIRWRMLQALGGILLLLWVLPSTVMGAISVWSMVPLSHSVSAWIVQPAFRHSQAMVFIPNPVGYWQTRTLSNVLKHQGVQVVDPLILDSLHTPAELSKNSHTIAHVLAKEGIQVLHGIMVPAPLTTEQPISPSSLVRLGYSEFLSEPLPPNALGQAYFITHMGRCGLVLLPYGQQLSPTNLGNECSVRFWSAGREASHAPQLWVISPLENFSWVPQPRWGTLQFWLSPWGMLVLSTPSPRVFEKRSF